MSKTTENPGAVENSTSKPDCAPASGSALERTNRRLVWLAIENIKMWAGRVEIELQTNPDGVIPWILVQSLSEENTKLIYSAGQVNASILERGRISPNEELKNAGPRTPDVRES